MIFPGYNRMSYTMSFPACPKWSYGSGCSSECQCVQQNTLECHRRHGTCVCKPGYQGKTCNLGQFREFSSLDWQHVCEKYILSVVLCFLECDSGYYGPGCKSKCQCPVGVSCHHMTGQCRRQCPAGLHGEHCERGEFKSCISWNAVTFALHCARKTSIKVDLWPSLKVIV